MATARRWKQQQQRLATGVPSTSGCQVSRLQQTRCVDGHAVCRGHHLLQQLPWHVLHHRLLIENTRLEVKISKVPFDPTADAVR